MRPSYEDITKRISEKPKWYDWHGVPRYEKFHPLLASNIYASAVCLLKIRCQACHEKFLVELNYDRMRAILQGLQPTPLESLIREKTIHYGDPPIHGCAGDTMNSEPDRVIQYWHRPNFEWERDQSLEISVEDEDDLL